MTRKILFDRESPSLRMLRELIERGTRLSLAVWAVESSPRVLELFESLVPGDPRPRLALEAAGDWMRGRIKMPAARQAALGAHAAAREALRRKDFAAAAAARAMGHVVGTVHAETHAMGVAMYALTAFAYANSPKFIKRKMFDKWPEGFTVETLSGVISGEAAYTVLCELSYMQERLVNQSKFLVAEGRWAMFLLREGPNRELLLREKLSGQKAGAARP